MNNEAVRLNAESAIRRRLRRSKFLGRGLAVLSVAAGITLGVASENDKPAIVASEGLAGVAMIGGVATAASTQRKCRRIINDYRQLTSSEPLPAPHETDGIKDAAQKPGRFAFRQFDRAVYPINGALLPLMAWYGAAEVASYAEYGGNILPAGLRSLLDGSQGFDPGLAFGAAMAVQGSLLLSTGVSRFEQHYIRQLDEIDGLDAAGHVASV
jgi:hypothetical protein